MFRVANREYEITAAALELFARTREDIICWGVKVTAQHRGDAEGPARWDPSIIADVLLETTPGEKAYWRDIVGTTVQWEKPNEDPQALFEVFETAPIYDCRCQFVRGAAQGEVRLVLDGVVDVDTEHFGLSIRVDTPLTVAPWPCGKMSERACRDEFRRLGLRDAVSFQLIQGVSYLVFEDR